MYMYVCAGAGEQARLAGTKAHTNATVTTSRQRSSARFSRVYGSFFFFLALFLVRSFSMSSFLRARGYMRVSYVFNGSRVRRVSCSV